MSLQQLEGKVQQKLLSSLLLQQPKFHKFSIASEKLKIKSFTRKQIATSKTRRRRYFPPRESRPNPANAFKLSLTSIGQTLPSAKFCEKVEKPMHEGKKRREKNSSPGDQSFFQKHLEPLFNTWFTSPSLDKKLFPVQYIVPKLVRTIPLNIIARYIWFRLIYIYIF